MVPILTALFCFFSLLISPGVALALQVHPTPEGLYAHQIAHAFFIFSMATYIFWLQKSRLVEKKGWRYIQISCVFFILWNIGAMGGHIIDHKMSAEAFSGSGWRTALVVERAIAPYLYYFLKMDHLLCLPAIILFCHGLKMLKLVSKERSG